MVGWIAEDNASSRLSTTLSSSLCSQESGQSNPHSDHPSSHHGEAFQTSDPTLGYSEELFPAPLLDLALAPSTLEEVPEILCPDSQPPEPSQSQEDDGGERQSFVHEMDDDETQLSITEDVVRSSHEDEQSEEVEEEVVDDEVTDPTWEGEKPSEDSSTEGEESATPQQSRGGSGVAKGRRRPTPNRPSTITPSTPMHKSTLPRGRCWYDTFLRNKQTIKEW